MFINAHFVAEHSSHALASSATARPTFSIEEEVVVIRSGWIPKKRRRSIHFYLRRLLLICDRLNKLTSLRTSIKDPNGSCLFSAGSPTDTVGSQNFRTFSTRQIAFLMVERPMPSMLHRLSATVCRRYRS